MVFGEHHHSYELLDIFSMHVIFAIRVWQARRAYIALFQYLTHHFDLTAVQRCWKMCNRFGL